MDLINAAFNSTPSPIRTPSPAPVPVAPHTVILSATGAPVHAGGSPLLKSTTAPPPRRPPPPSPPTYTSPGKLVLPHEKECNNFRIGLNHI